LQGSVARPTSGATVNASLISGLSSPVALALSGSDLFVTNYSTGKVGEYSASGATVNAALISGLRHPTGIAVSGSNLFVAVANNTVNNGVIGEYTTSGAVVNASLVSGLADQYGVVGGSNANTGAAAQKASANKPGL
jgi:hypothetical protein